MQLTEGTERPACWVHPAFQVPWKEAVCICAQHLPCWHKGADLGKQSTRGFSREHGAETMHRHTQEVSSA